MKLKTLKLEIVTIQERYTEKQILGFGPEIAGIAGYQSAGTVENCFNAGKITCRINSTTENTALIGGILGRLTKGESHNVYNLGKIDIFSEGSRVRAGGIVGSSEGVVANSYNVGDIMNVNQSSNFYLGEILGYAYESASTSNSFYLNNEPIGNNLSSNCVTTKVTSEQLKSDETLNLLNQNETVWKKDTSNINNGYPIFTWQ